MIKCENTVSTANFILSGIKIRGRKKIIVASKSGKKRIKKGASQSASVEVYATRLHKVKIMRWAVANKYCERLEFVFIN